MGEREVMPVHITHAHDIDSGDDLVCQGGLIPNIELQCGEPRRLEVTIETDVELSLVLER